uniref:hypothetical protein n=1 Tax=Acinetobacter gerneri TaxID=202952 RepID=UPI00293BEAB0|nr:hypothetical protein [Acinetobacter gerneri]WNL65064.1 hypothetical protein GPGIFMOB_00015 [Acinetobacter gerneri]
MTNSKTIAKTKENRLNKNGSLSKTDQRKLKPISFCLLDTEQVTMLEKIEKFQYGNFFKNIIASMTDEEVEQIANSNKKSDPIIPQKLLDLNITKGFLSCRSIAKVLFKHNKVESMLDELRNFISDEFILKLAEDRNLTLSISDSEVDSNTSSGMFDDRYAMADTGYKSRTTPVFNQQNIESIKSIVREHEKLPKHVELDNDFIEQFMNDNPEVFAKL